MRIGIHTGSPTVHDGGYVGMDVHRAARIAGAAHGGQVLLSDTTAHLVVGGLPSGVDIVDLGAHRLKDLPTPERLYQLRLAGLLNEFPPLRSLGAASSLPTAATRLIGRQDDLRSISQTIASRTTRLVTLTGPGGAGKTRLSIALAHELISAFPDGVFFVPLAQVTEAAGMWASIGEVLDVPTHGRQPPAVFEHLSQRSGLFVLDNLEQVREADAVVAQLLAHAPEAVLLATSRRPLHLEGEQEHTVEPLSLPDRDGLDDVSGSDAVRLFVDHASRTREHFTLDVGNAAAVAAICRRLDGLPLAIELAAARSKLLSPQALLARLDQALDLRAPGTQGPERQRTLRSTIDWSYALLSDAHQTLFRRLSALSGGGDLQAVEALAAADGADGALASEDVLDLVAGLVDASLVTITDGADAEPRVGMLQMMRAFALDQLRSAGEEDMTRAGHAEHYMSIVEHLSPSIRGPQHREARARLTTELDNLREALEWTTGPGDGSAASLERARIGLRLCVAMNGYWGASGSISEALRWFPRAIGSADPADSVELARCLTDLGRFERLSGHIEQAHAHETAAVEMWRRLGPQPTGPALACSFLGLIEAERGEIETANGLFTEALGLARAAGDLNQLCSVLINAAFVLGQSLGDYERALAMETEAIGVAEAFGDPAQILRCQGNAAVSMRLLGRLEEARDLTRTLAVSAFELDLPVQRAELAEDYAAILAELGDTRSAVLLFGTADAYRDRLGTPRSSMQTRELADALRRTHEQLDEDDWKLAYGQGQAVTVQEAFALIEADGEPAGPVESVGPGSPSESRSLT